MTGTGGPEGAGNGRRDLVVGLGCRPGTPADDIRRLLTRLLDRHGLRLAAVRAFATVDARAGEPGLLAVAGPGLLSYPPQVLAEVPVPNPSTRVAAAVRSPSVAEAAALHAAESLAGPGEVVRLIAPKLAGTGVTGAVARFG